MLCPRSSVSKAVVKNSALLVAPDLWELGTASGADDIARGPEIEPAEVTKNLSLWLSGVHSQLIGGVFRAGILNSDRRESVVKTLSPKEQRQNAPAWNCQRESIHSAVTALILPRFLS